MHNWGIPLILFGIVILLVIGQWITRRRARSVEGQPAPEGLLSLCPGDGLVFFETSRCPACRQMRPLLERLETESDVRVCRVDIREHPDMAMQLRIMGTPTLMLVIGGRIRSVRLGLVSMKTLQDFAAQLPQIGSTLTKAE